MVPFAIVTLVTVLLALGMGVYIQMYGKRHHAALPLALYSYGISIWALGKFLLWMGALPGWEVFFARLSVAGAIVIPLFFLLFVLRFLEEDRAWGKMMVIIALMAGVLEITNFGSGIVSSVSPSPNGYLSPMRGNVYPLYMAYFIVPILIGMWRLTIHLKDPAPDRRNQIRYIFVASLLSSIGSGAAFAVVFGYSVPPVLLAFVPLYIPLAFAAIWRHRLFDIELVARKGIVYSAALGIATAGYLFALFILRDLLKGTFPVGAVPISLLVALLAVIMFEPIRKQLERWVDEVFYQDQVRVEKEISFVAQKLQGVLDLAELVRTLVISLAQALSAKGVAVYLLDIPSHQFVFQAGIGMEGGTAPDHPHLHALAHPLHVRETNSFPDQMLRTWLMQEKVELLVPIRTENQCVGVVLLRGKRNKKPYTMRDMSILRLSLTQIAVAMENARLHEGMLQRERDLARTHRLATVGSMAAGLAHEAKNPLAAIKGMTGVLRENLDDPEFLENFSRTVPAQIDRIQQLLERVLRVGRRDQKSEEVDIGSVVQEVLRLTEFLARRQRVEVRQEMLVEEKFSVPKEECTQIFLNLILNALQAMPDGGKLLVRAVHSYGNLYCEVSDTGAGIPEEMRRQIFEPFYSTKTDGTGLGLFVVRSHVIAMGGEISVVCPPEGGTMFKFTLPVRRESRILNPILAD